MVETIICIPARFASTRFPGKPLVNIRGKPMIRWVAEAAVAANIGPVFVATDTQLIADKVSDIAIAVITKEFQNGTERCWDVAKKIKPKYIINLQGDSPLIKPQTLIEINDELKKSTNEKNVVVASKRCELRETLKDKNVVKCIVKGKKVIDFTRIYSALKESTTTSVQIHAGVYGFSYRGMEEFVKRERTPRERREQLEQLRILGFTGWEFTTVEIDYIPHHVDVAKDVDEVSRLLNHR